MTDSQVLILPDGRLAYSVPQLPNVAPFSVDTFRRAIRKPKDDGEFPPPLPARKDSKGKAVVLTTDLQRWLELLPDF
jgi:hypothetical protein